MTELWLSFTNKNLEPERILVNREKFEIGRHSDCDLSVSDSSISRQHARIERFGDIFVLSDLGSSFGTKINGEELLEPIGLKNGDQLRIGGEFEISVELIADEIKEETSENVSAPPVVSASSESTSSIPTSFFIIAPIFGLLVLLCAGGGMFIALSDGKTSDKSKLEELATPDEEREPRSKPSVEKEARETPKTAETNVSIPSSSTSPADTPKESEIPELPKTSTDSAKIEQISPSFLRRIVRNDPSAFLTGKQIEILIPKISQLKSSPALAANIKDAKANSSQIAALATSTNLTAQFLATAALAKLGNQRGNVVETAKGMVSVLNELNRSIGVETADEALLVIAAYDQGVAGKFTQMRNNVEAMSGKTQGVTARQVRTIWFLNEKGKLSSSEFDFALRFLAIGTITQKPSEFSVNAEALNL